MRSCALGLALLLIAASAEAADLVTPDPSLTPKDVIGIQLAALQSNDSPEPDAGIAQTWAFAHPANKRITGPLPRFAEMIKAPQYRQLLGHRSHEIEPVSRSDAEAVFAVRIVTSAGEIVGYWWSVAKVDRGEAAGSWMTTAVSPPMTIGDPV